MTEEERKKWNYHPSRSGPISLLPRPMWLIANGPPQTNRIQTTPADVIRMMGQIGKIVEDDHLIVRVLAMSKQANSTALIGEELIQFTVQPLVEVPNMVIPVDWRYTLRKLYPDGYIDLRTQKG